MNSTYVIYVLCMGIISFGLYLLCQQQSRLLLRMKREEVMAKAPNVKERISKSSMVRRRRQERMDREICESISFLRNMIAIEKGTTVSGDYVLQQLTQREGLLKPIYVKTLSLLRVNRKSEAERLFSEEVGTTIGNEFAALLLQWDEINPAELAEILLSHQKNIKEVSITLQKRRDEVISDLIYMPVVVNIFIILINFIYVSYFMEQKEMFQMLF